MKSFLISAITGAAAAVNTKAYNTQQAQNSLWLSEYAYCGHSLYEQVTWGGAATGFQLSYIIFDSSNDTNGYIGYLPSDDSIYVVYRGSETILNWITDLNVD
jgi:hypothetical protein